MVLDCIPISSPDDSAGQTPDLPELPHRWEWLGEALAVDFANTTKRRGAVDVELLAAPEQLASWARHERGRVPELPARAAAGRLAEVVAFRDRLRGALHALVAGQPVEREAAAALNARVRAVPLVTELRGAATELRTVDRADPLDELLARVAASAIELTGRPGALGFCDAPSCGQFFERGRSNQRWCSDACGTRARVARHAGHRRGPRAP